MNDVASYGRSIVYALWIPGIQNQTFDIQFEAKSFQHRSWNHVCVIYSSVTNKVSIYNNGKFSGAISHESLPEIPGSETVHDHSFTLGQEPDTLHGSYSSDQALYGSVSELNIWNYSINELKIQEIANCTFFWKGNVVSWKEENFKSQNIEINGIDDEVFTFRNSKKSYVIFPQKLLKIEAEEICDAHGGSLVTPKSEQENNEILNVLSQHKESCLDTVDGDNYLDGLTGSWMALIKTGVSWITPHDHSEITTRSFNKWSGSLHDQNFQGMCSRMKPNGIWLAEPKEACKKIRICTVCQFTKVPIFSIMGLCEKWSQFHWNYYLNVNDSYQIDKYEGYKRFQSISLNDNGWSHEYKGDKITLPRDKVLIGRNTWIWNEKHCKGESTQRNLTFSACNLGEEFTCDSGKCISMEKRCDNIKDCSDGSDEEECVIIDIPQSYEKLDPPLSKSNEALPVDVTIAIENINHMDTENMIIDTSMNLNMRWKDSRLSFRNLPKGRKKLIKYDLSKKLWLPSENLVYLNAILEPEHVYSDTHISAQTDSSPFAFDINRHREEYIYAGLNTAITIEKKIRIKTICNFNFMKFPFDKQHCPIVMSSVP